jgi:N-acetylglucosamine-6-phosphate deacetylase
VIHYGIIVDGIHTHSAAIRLAHRVHPQGLVLVTDAVPALGLPDGTYHMGADQIIVKNKRATIAGTETLCGSIASLAECVQNMRQALLDGEKNVKSAEDKDKTKFIVESIEAATLHPATGKFEKQRICIPLIEGQEGVPCKFFSSRNQAERQTEP